MGLDIILLCWLIFILYWVISAFFVKRAVKRYTPRGGIFLIAILVLLALERNLFGPFQNYLFEGIFTTTLFLQITSVLLVISGLLFAVMARTAIGRNWSGSITIKEKHELITRGPYRLVRHPIYTGIMAMLVGTAVYYRSTLTFIILIFSSLGLLMKIRAEESLMTKHFGKKYIEYKKRTKVLIPFIW